MHAQYTYLIEQFDEPTFTHSSGDPFYTEEHYIEALKKRDERLKELGDEGWDLVSVIANGTSREYYFKRCTFPLWPFYVAAPVQPGVAPNVYQPDLRPLTVTAK